MPGLTFVNIEIKVNSLFDVIRKKPEPIFFESH